MRIDEIKLLFDYDHWADQRIMAACARVSQEEFLAPTTFGTGRGGLRPTLVHMVDSLWQWKLTLQGYYKDPLTEEEYDAAELRDIDFPTFEAMEERWATEHRELRAHVDTLTDKALNSVLRYTVAENVRERVVWHCLLHVVNHATQHRAEAAALLTGYGQSPGDLDFTLFMNELTGPPL